MRQTPVGFVITTSDVSFDTNQGDSNGIRRTKLALDWSNGSTMAIVMMNIAN